MPERLVVIGGDASGMAAAAQAKRRRPDLDVVALERGNWTSYTACGIPYLVGGDVESLEKLVVRSPEEHHRRGIDARVGHEAVAIDTDAAKVQVHDLNDDGKRTYELGYDHLVVATGAVPRRPPLPGFDDPRVHGVQTLDDGAHLLEHVQETGAKRVAVVGAGYIGLEMAEAFVKRGLHVTVVEREDHVLPATMDADMAVAVRDAMERHGIDVRTGEPVEAFDDGAVVTAAGPIEAELVVLGLGVAPNSSLAADAGIEIGKTGAIAVDVRQRTGSDGVWAAGDCCEAFHLILRRPVHLPLGTVANKQGRVVGINIGGGYATFPGVVGTAVTKLCDTEVARTGLSERDATRAGFEFEAVAVDSTTRAGYFPGAMPLTVKLLAERRSGHLLGGQIVGQEGAAKRIDVLATCIAARFTVEEMLGLDLSYAPPFAPAWDPVLIAARKTWEKVETER